MSFENLKSMARENEVIKGYLDSEKVTLGREIFTARSNQRMTQTELAMLAGISQYEVSRCEAGDCDIDETIYMKIKKGLDVKLQ